MRCDERSVLRGAVGTLDCGRESGHPGMHFDRAEHLYWFPGAPDLEAVEIAPGVRAQRIPDRTNWSVACLTGDHDRCTGKTNPEYIGGVADCECEHHTDRANGSER